MSLFIWRHALLQRFGAGLFVWLLVSVSAGAAERPSAAQLTGFFADVAFGNEYRDFTKSGKVVQKWLNPIRVSISSLKGRMLKKPDGGNELKLENQMPPEAAVQMIQKHLITLVKLTGVITEDVKKVGKPANFFIKIVPRLAMHAPFLVEEADPKLLLKMAQSGGCYFLTAAKEGEILWATIVVNSELSQDRMDSCILEEMTQALGLPNDSDLVQPSIFNQRSVLQTLTRTDLILIATLYDENLKAGTPVDEAWPVIGGVIRHLNEVLPVQ